MPPPVAKKSSTCFVIFQKCWSYIPSFIPDNVFFFISGGLTDVLSLAEMLPFFSPLPFDSSTFLSDSPGRNLLPLNELPTTTSQKELFSKDSRSLLSSDLGYASPERNSSFYHSWRKHQFLFVP